MKFEIRGQNVSVYDSTKSLIEKKLTKLGKFFSEDTICHVSLSTQKNERVLEVTIPVNGGILRAEEKSDDFHYCIDQVISVLEKQIRRHRSKLIDKKRQNANSFSELFDSTEEDLIEEDAIKIEKVKKFSFKPMDPIEACLQMDMIGHDFFVFENSEIGKTCVVYKRKNGTYGIIEPED